MTPDSLQLYHNDGSPNSRRVRIYLAEKGLAIPMIAVDLGAKEQFSAAYVAINPQRVVPTLVLEDGTGIGEVPAIWRFVEETFPEPPILGSTPKEKAEITMWERRIELEGFNAVMETVRNKVPGLKDRAIAGPHAYEQIPALVERGERRIANFYEDLDRRLRSSSFVAGEAFSVADITAVVTVDFATKALNLSIPKSSASMKTWYDKVSGRPSMTA